MPDFFCPYLGRRVKEASGSSEHIIPKSLGGTDELVVTVDRDANSQLGTAVDAPTVALLAIHRVKHNLAGQSGRDPTFSLPFSVPDLGHHDGVFEVTEEGSSTSLKPRVTKVENPDGSVSYSVEGDPVRAKKIADDIRLSYEAKGKTVVEQPIKVQCVDKPRVTGELSVDLVALLRFQAKVALGLGHLLWGETWSGSPDAEPFRRALWASTAEDLDAAGIVSGTRTPEQVGLTLEDFEHAFIISSIPGFGIAVGIFLFGQQGVLFRMTDVQGASRGENVVMLFDVRTGTLRRAAFDELVREGKLRL